MTLLLPPGSNHDTHAPRWADRCEYWIGLETNTLPTRRRRERSQAPLVLCGFGVSLRVEAGTLLIRNGFTHYPQQREEFRYFRGDLNRPARIILLDGSGSISFDVLDWLAEQEIPLIRISWTGQVVTVAGAGYSADPKKVERQRKMRADPAARLKFSCDLIRQKIENSFETLQAEIPVSENRDRAILKLQAELDGFNGRPARNIDHLRGIEGSAGKAYFSAWHGVPLRWAGNKRRPIPSDWWTIGPRSSALAEKTSKNRNATHPINAMLNYAYAVLEAQVRIQAVADGYDPTIGIMHHDYRDGPTFVLDKMEPLRPVVDREVLKLALGNELHSADFVLRSDGVCRLNPQLARRAVQLVTSAEISNYLEGVFGRRPRVAATVPLHHASAPQRSESATASAADKRSDRSTLGFSVPALHSTDIISVHSSVERGDAPELRDR
jgi:CRISP-associated protein Cas1